MPTALKIAVDGSITTITPDGLDDYQREVDGYIEQVQLGQTHVLIVNEEGKIHSLPHNPRATALCRIFHAIDPSDFIAGDALILSDDGAEWGDVEPTMAAFAHAI